MMKMAKHKKTQKISPSRQVQKSNCKLIPKKVGITLGILFSSYVLLLGLLSLLFGWGTAIVHMISSIYLGYSASLKGLIIGVFWGFIDGFIAGYLFSWIYNKLN